MTTYLLCCEGVLQQTVGIYIITYIRRVRRCQRGYQNAQIVEGQTTQLSKEKVQKEKQRSTKYTHKTKDQATRTPLKTGG